MKFSTCIVFLVLIFSKAFSQNCIYSDTNIKDDYLKNVKGIDKYTFNYDNKNHIVIINIITDKEDNILIKKYSCENYIQSSILTKNANIFIDKINYVELLKEQIHVMGFKQGSNIEKMLISSMKEKLKNFDKKLQKELRIRIDFENSGFDEFSIELIYLQQNLLISVIEAKMI